MFAMSSKNIFFNKYISEYCMQSTMKSIRNIIERYNQERENNTIKWNNKLKHGNSLVIFENPNPNNNNLHYIILAIFPVIYYKYVFL
jgi:hypothetical protein